ncbi:hypothetical protein Poli38472_013126 [Pythium oligandrum]|uniref:Uncharacterized protein n=1 Tax=Pythium oligandrum TaxID=41045 RepID=A0A8K1C2I3_PYTOL|nr:hypothetical protein Poli38472_013126 [Pythium oligandrum]|eukprot:TMW55235.1 hypothetical protein Poli38472_013126 [Pythium oligandrum]
MVLRCFDFTVDSRHRFNVPVIDHHEQGGQFSPSSLRIQNLSLRHKLRRPTWYLHENLKYWKYLGIYFRPSQFQFLSTIQMGEQDISTWPKHENAFTLFSDLAFLVDKISILSKHVYTNLSQTERAHPCLLSRMLDPVIPDREDLMLLKQCGIMPHFWTNGSGAVSPKWSGLATSSTDGSYMFPVCHPSFQQALETLVKRECSDWRVVQAANSDTAQENTSLIFYLGQTVRSQRWLGFVGSKLQYQHSQN